MWIAFGPVFTCGADQDSELANNVRAALALSTRGVLQPEREDWKQIQKPMLDAAGAKSWAILAKRAKAVGLKSEGELVRITPSASYENDGGTDLPERAITSHINADTLGQSLIKALDTSS